jgi:hypothetical protein
MAQKSTDDVEDNFNKFPILSRQMNSNQAISIKLFGIEISIFTNIRYDNLGTLMNSEKVEFIKCLVFRVWYEIYDAISAC